MLPMESLKVDVDCIQKLELGQLVSIIFWARYPLPQKYPKSSK